MTHAEQIRAAKTPEDYAALPKLTHPIPDDVQDALADRLNSAAENGEKLLRDAGVLHIDGQTYPLSEWLTPQKYAERFGLAGRQVVINWMARGVIPAENIRELPELGTRLVKAVPYETKTYKRKE